MSLTTAIKATIVQKFQQKNSDTGSPEIQIALLTENIKVLTKHLKIHNHDYHSRRGLLRMVSKRRSLLRYLKNKALKRYRRLISTLKLRD